MPAIGTCFQLLLSDDTECNHFWIVISKPLDGRVLVANLTWEENCPDSPCRFAINEHPVIAKPSVIYYLQSQNL
jgi:hypothetical protein